VTCCAAEMQRGDESRRARSRRGRRASRLGLGAEKRLVVRRVCKVLGKESSEEQSYSYTAASRPDFAVGTLHLNTEMARGARCSVVIDSD
jgi:hypothetical protein